MAGAAVGALAATTASAAESEKLADPAALEDLGAAAPAAEWGEGWDTAGGDVAENSATDTAATTGAEAEGDGGVWSESLPYGDAIVGGGKDFFYYSDGESSITLG